MTEHQVERLLTSLETIHDQLLAIAVATNDSRAALETLSTLVWMHGAGKSKNDFENYASGKHDKAE